ncbi:uncharacterized protein EDB91DRAFT_1254310 [Suillus paluster]|uniref:uncharacterized protein n=1 Tax=Suillus paluster TaxID=48578 RepID=UPI001B874503|nr:uncharacterized protein EDB91DRAFT_1254310 [Suillus paluster]KAG1726413.1 hypothetical protein EDB91DRAFT_1254310 [Suillus paluster]
MAKAFKSAEIVDDTDMDVMELTSSSLSESDSDENSGSTAIVEQALCARDSIDCELDAMDRPPLEASVPAMAIPPTQQQRKKGQMKNAAKQCQATVADESPLLESLITMYNISIFPIAEMKKDDPKKRKGTNTYLKLGLSEPFDTFKAQVLQKINEQTKPEKISYDNYTALYAIP